jgi:hypothetical protein
VYYSKRFKVKKPSSPSGEASDSDDEGRRGPSQRITRLRKAKKNLDH